ncbi:Protein of uncharacterised function (DUF1016) [Sphingobacterium thalpophilum]|uniref:Protein of uncharacterized function (DUF1016) n=1 Tax=Sphingobacterium thalpophilum TaxID=259 RepID=A0A4U9VPE2_9SPHI|nr:Protein of uncharacterised function (DUF1016) [Sphingobacterium thalpophilum]
MDNRFTDIINLIQKSRSNAIKAVNIELINLYWNVGALNKDYPLQIGEIKRLMNWQILFSKTIPN